MASLMQNSVLETLLTSVALQLPYQAQSPDILVVDNTSCLAMPNAVIKVTPDVGGEDKTTAMMAMCIPMVIKEMLQELLAPLFHSSSKTEDRSQNPSGVLQKLDRPDMLIMVAGATSFVGQDKGQGNERQSVTKLEGYVKGGLAPLHYGTIKCLQCYAAAGSRVTFGKFNDIGKVTWMQQTFDMAVASHRALLVFVVVNLLRWFTLMAKALPEKRFRIQLLETWRRSSHVTITFQPGGRQPYDHAGSVVMRDFRIPNVLTRNGAEGSYVISDLEFAGPDKHPWTLDYLQGWDHHTLNQEGQYDTFSDMYQIGKLIEGLPFWGSSVQAPMLLSFGAQCIRSGDPVQVRNEQAAGMSSGVGRGFTSTQVAASAQRDDNLQPVTDTIILSGGSEDDSYHVEPSLQAIQRPPGHMEAGKACASCKQRSNCDQLNVCGSCNEPVHLYCTASLLWPLSQYCYFCQPCKEEPHLRGAVFEALSFHGKAGATVRQIEEFVQERQDICLEERASKSYEKKTYEKLRGSHESVRSLLTRMAHSNQGKNIGFQVEVAPQSRSTRTSEKYRLKLENQADWDLLPEAGCVEETGFCMQEWMQRVAESGQDTSATNNANRRLFRELDDRRSSAQLGAKNKRTFTASASSDVSNKSSVHKAPSNEAMRRQIEELEADRLTKSDGGVLIQPVVKKAKNADLQGQAAQKAGSKRDRLQLSASEGASPEQILQSAKASLSALKTWKPDDAKNPEDVTVNNNPKVARVQQLLTKLKPKLEGPSK
ncbi:hypothetical protein WJX82_011028 [Trebouxia sp. C0006]